MKEHTPTLAERVWRVRIPLWFGVRLNIHNNHQLDLQLSYIDKTHWYFAKPFICVHLIYPNGSKRLFFAWFGAVWKEVALRSEDDERE